ncbi:MAG: prolipoprotein diacylglyceryl transferase family protein [Nanoarchaeota archaeon]
MYEAIKNFVIFIILWQLHNLFVKNPNRAKARLGPVATGELGVDQKLPKGFVFWTFVFLYGSIRFILEFVKVVPDYVFGLTWGQFWSVPMTFVGGYMLWKLLKPFSKHEGLKASAAKAVVSK